MIKLQEQYARLFKGKPRSNDVSLINEEVAVYNHYKNSDDETVFTGRIDGKSFDVITGTDDRNQWKYYIKDKLDVSGKLEADLTPALDKYIKDVDLDPKEFGKVQGPSKNLARDQEFKDAVEYIYDQASDGNNMTDDITDEMGDFYDDVQSSTDKDIKDAYSELRSYIDGRPEEQAEAAKVLLDLLG